VSQAQGNPTIFEKPVVECVIDFKWESYGRVCFLLLTVISTVLALHFSFYSVYSLSLSFNAQLLWGALVALNASPLMVYELLEVAGWQHHLWTYLSNYWNAVDLITYWGLIANVVLRLLIPYHHATFIISGAVVLALWLKLLYYFRGFRSTGPLVRVIIRIIYDIGYFLLILLVFLAGFSFCFFTITQTDLHDYDGGDEALDTMKASFGTMWLTLMSLFSAMTGNYDLSLFQGSSFYGVLTVLYILYILAQAIIMLNLLIAIMGDSFENVQQMARGEWRGEQTKIILELEGVVAKVSPSILAIYNPRWLNVLRVQGKEFSGGGQGDEWSGRVRAITGEMHKSMKEGLSQLAAQKNEILQELTALKGGMKQLAEQMNNQAKREEEEKPEVTVEGKEEHLTASKQALATAVREETRKLREEIMQFMTEGQAQSTEVGREVRQLSELFHQLLSSNLSKSDNDKKEAPPCSY